MGRNGDMGADMNDTGLYKISRPPVMRLIRLNEVLHRVGLGRSTIYRWMDEGKFPKPYTLGGHSVAWLEAEIDAWISSKLD